MHIIRHSLLNVSSVIGLLIGTLSLVNLWVLWRGIQFDLLSEDILEMYRSFAYYVYYPLTDIIGLHLIDWQKDALNLYVVFGRAYARADAKGGVAIPEMDAMSLNDWHLMLATSGIQYEDHIQPKSKQRQREIMRFKPIYWILPFLLDIKHLLTKGIEKIEISKLNKSLQKEASRGSRASKENIELAIGDRAYWEIRLWIKRRNFKVVMVSLMAPEVIAEVWINLFS